MITRPTLPPKAGYIEVETPAGRAYAKAPGQENEGTDPEPDPMEQLRADVDYLSVMTGVEL